MPHFEITAAVLVHCNIVNNDDQQDAKVQYAFVPNNSFAQLFHFSQIDFDSELSYTQVWFTHQNSKSLEIRDTININ